MTDNAHPHLFDATQVALVHNGIIENYESLREMLRGKGYEFVSQTDTEVIAHLIHSMYRGDLFADGARRREATARRVCDRRDLQG